MLPTVPHQAEPTLKRLRALSLFSERASWTELTDGTINRVWTVQPPGENPVIARVGPSRREAEAGPSWMRADALACEAIVLDRVRTEVTGVPVTIASGFRDRERSWLVQTVVPGRPMDQALPHLSAKNRACLWRELGMITRRLHTVSGTWFGTPDGRQRYPDWPSMARADAAGMLEDARR
jgi:hypothetical protein